MEVVKVGKQWAIAKNFRTTTDVKNTSLMSGTPVKSRQVCEYWTGMHWHGSPSSAMKFAKEKEARDYIEVNAVELS